MEANHLTDEQRRMLLEKLLNTTREKSVAAKEIEKYPISPRERTIILSMFQEAVHKRSDRLSEAQLDEYLETFLKKPQGEAMNAINGLDIDSRDKYLLRQRYQSRTSPQGPKIIQGYKVDPDREKPSFEPEAPPKKKTNWWFLVIIAGIFIALIIAVPYFPKSTPKPVGGTTSSSSSGRFAEDAIQARASAGGGSSSGSGSGSGGTGSFDVRSEAEIEAESREITLTEQEVMSHRYNDLETGMSYDEVTQRLADFGSPTLITEDQGAGTATYLWVGPDNTEIMCFFENGALTGKSQQGLDAD